MSNINNITCGCETFISTKLRQYDFNKCKLTQLEKLDKLYINAASTSILQISKKYYIKYKNKIFSKHLHIHLRACDSALSYHFPSLISG